MNKLLLHFNVKLVSFCIEKKKKRWNAYVLYTGLLVFARCILRKNKKRLTDNEVSIIFKDIDNYLMRENVCFLRTLIAYIYLVSYENSFEMAFGVRLNPFKAHAWITSENMPIQEREDITEYSRFMKVT